MVKHTIITESDMETVKKHLPGLLNGQVPKSKVLQGTLTKVITCNYVNAINDGKKDVAQYLMDLLCVIHPENR